MSDQPDHPPAARTDEDRARNAASARRSRQRQRDERRNALLNSVSSLGRDQGQLGPDSRPAMVGVYEFATLVGLSPSTVFRRLSDPDPQRRIASVKFGGRRLIPFAELSRLREGAAPEPAKPDPFMAMQRAQKGRP